MGAGLTRPGRRPRDSADDKTRRSLPFMDGTAPSFRGIAPAMSPEPRTGVLGDEGAAMVMLAIGSIGSGFRARSFRPPRNDGVVPSQDGSLGRSRPGWVPGLDRMD